MTAAEFINAYWPYIAIAAAVVLIAVWFVLRTNRKAVVLRETLTRDVLDEGAERAARNQALIDAGTPEPTLSEAANSQQVAHAGALADAEAGAQVAPSRPATPGGDDLTRIKGLGPKIASILNAHGITRFAQIAAWSETDIDEIDAKLGKFEGRIRRDAWIEQAKLLSSGEESRFVDKFGQNG